MVAGGRPWSAAALSYCELLALLEGLAVAWSPVVAAGRLRRCLVVNCSRSRSLRGSGGCVVAGGRRWSAAALSCCELQ